MSADLNLFFEALAARAYKENDLSDVTYAMCQSDSVFKKFFLDFFFPNANLSAEDASFEREHSANNGRPDFWIRVNNTTYIVEVKIWDGSHHFEQYNETLREENNCKEDDAWQYLGYITNYTLGHERVPVKTWKEMYEELKSYNGFNDPTIIAYMSYVKSVCGFETCNIDNFEFNSEDFKYIQTLGQEIDKCVDGDTTKPTDDTTKPTNIEAYNRSVNFKTKCWMGRYFELKEFKDDKSIWGFLGVTYKGDIANICVSFRDQNGWAKLLCDNYRTQIETLKSNDAIAYEYSELVFYMTEEEKNRGTSIKDFFRTVLEEIKKGSLDRVHKTRHNDDVLIAMKKLPLYLEQKFFDWSPSPFNIQISENQKDSESPNSYCGRYFELIINDGHNDQKTLPIRGWVGALYDSKEPKFVIQIDKNSEIAHTFKSWDEEDGAWKNLIYNGNQSPQLTELEGWFRDSIKRICSTQE